MIRLQTALPEAYTSAVPRGAGPDGSRPPRRPRRPPAHPRAPLPAGRGDALGRRPGRLLRPLADRRRPPRRRVRGLLRCPLHGRVGRHPDRRPPAGRSCRTSTPGAPWPTWPTWTRWRRPGTTSAAVTDVDAVVPVTYMNSSAALKAFVGRHGGAVCTSSNARAVLDWALGADRSGSRRGAAGRQGALLPRPAPGPQHRVPARLRRRGDGPLEPPARSGRPRRRRGQGGHASSLEGPLLGAPAIPARARRRVPRPAARRHRARPPRVRPRRGRAGRRGRIHRLHHPRRRARRRRARCIGIATEIHLVKRLADEHPDKHIECLDPLVCPCSTMFRIDAAHLAWVLEGLVDGHVRNQIIVDPETARWADVALQRMLQIT